jgi:hypothetical protein
MEVMFTMQVIKEAVQALILYIINIYLLCPQYDGGIAIFILVMNGHIYLIYIVLLFISCEETQIQKFGVEKTTTIEVDLNEAEDRLAMSRFVQKLEYRILNTPDNDFIGRIRKIIPQGNRIAFYDEARKSVWVHTTDGEYINEVSIPEGRGPGELTDISDIIYTKDRNIHALGPFKIVVYNEEGEFLRETDFDFFIYKFAWLSEADIYVGYADNSLNPMLEDHDAQNLLFFDSSGNVIKSEIPIPKGREHIKYQIPNRFPSYNEKIYFFPFLSDTIYSIGNGVTQQEYIIDYGQQSLTDEVFDRRSDYSNVAYEWQDFFRSEIIANSYVSFVRYLVNSDSVMLLSVSTGQNSYIVLYDRSRSDITVSSENFYNDIDNGFVPSMFEGGGNKLYSIIEPYQLINHLNELYENDPDTYAEPKTRHLIELSQKVKEADNPILIIATLKS